MKKNYTEIAFVLDRSGSMESCQEAAIAGFNHFLHDQQRAEGLAKLTLVLFDDEYLRAGASVPVRKSCRSPGNLHTSQHYGACSMRSGRQ